MKILTLIAAPAPLPSVLILEPEEPPVREGLSRVVPIYIGAPEALSLSSALEQDQNDRPLTHDLIADMLVKLNATVDHVLINDVQGNTFYARLTLSHFGRLVDLDARPSDAISMAAYFHAPLFMNDRVLDQTSFPHLHRGDRDAVAELNDFKDFLNTITPDDFIE